LPTRPSIQYRGCPLYWYKQDDRHLWQKDIDDSPAPRTSSHSCYPPFKVRPELLITAQGVSVLKLDGNPLGCRRRTPFRTLQRSLPRVCPFRQARCGIPVDYKTLLLFNRRLRFPFHFCPSCLNCVPGALLTWNANRLRAIDKDLWRPRRR
jgi:hypothetical protein